jgi:hypothetical protein
MPVGLRARGSLLGGFTRSLSGLFFPQRQLKYNAEDIILENKRASGLIKDINYF